MKRYRVKMISRDNNEYIVVTDAPSEMKAISKAEAKVIENGWEHYGYGYDSIEKVSLDYSSHKQG